MTTAGAHYTVLARRFRPQAFDDVVGQDHVARALRNAIRAGRVAHAYMFTGARGVGKTSTARILAKALNCPNAVDGVPCNQCEICDGISAGNDVDVLEIDGASNRGIDDIRSLRANVGVKSMRTRFKVYIIDEVHMLTKEAFNALLKTLEEPPPNVKFVFCTTEPNKVPDTILSRCQRFDFSSIADQSIADRLREIAKIEGFEVSEDALELVARRARGSMRDSQSLFDQLLAFSDGTVKADDVHRMLGTAGDERLLDLFTSITERRPGEVLAQLDAAFGAGVQSGELMDQCIGYVRDLMVVMTGSQSIALNSVASRHRPTLHGQATRLGMTGVMAAFQILADARSRMFRSTFARTILEMAMVQVSLLENLTALSELLSGKLPSLPELPAPSANTEVEKKNSELTRTALAGSERTTATLSLPVPSTEEMDADSDDMNESDQDDDGDAAVVSTSMPVVNSATAPGNSPAGSGDATAAAPVSAPGESEPVSSSSAPLIELSQDTCGQLFQELIRSVGLTIAAGLRKATGLTLASPTRLEVLVESSAEFARKVLDVPENRMKIEAEVLRLTGRTVAIGLRLTTPERAEASPSTPSAGASAPAPTRSGQQEKPASTPTGNNVRAPGKVKEPSEVPQVNLLGEIDPSRDPFVRRVIDAFGASVVRVTAAPAVKSAEVEASSD